MALTKPNWAVNTIQSLTNQVVGQATALKTKFDKATLDIKTYINDTLTVEIDALDAANVKKTGDQTIAGVKTFSSSPIVPTPTTNMQAATKKYVDDNSPVADDSITNAKLGTDVKVGSLAESTTTDKGSVIEITNEINANFNGHLAESVYVDSFGAVGDGTTNDAVALQDALTASNGRLVIFGGKTYLIDLPDGGGLNIESNTTIIMQPNTKIKIKPNAFDSYYIFNIVSKDNITIIGNGGTIQGDKNTHLGVTGEWGLGICVRNSTRIKIDNINLIDCWGDGIYFGQVANAGYSSDISLSHLFINNNRRNGISLVSVKNLYGYDIKITNTGGTAPQAAIDIEPNVDDTINENIVFEKIYEENNVRGFLINKTKDGVWNNIVVKDSILKSGCMVDGCITGYIKNIKFKDVIFEKGTSVHSVETKRNIYSLFVEGCEVIGGSSGLDFYAADMTIKPLIWSIKDSQFVNQTGYSMLIRQNATYPFTQLVLDNVGVCNTPGFTPVLVHPFGIENLQNVVMRNCYSGGDILMNSGYLDTPVNLIRDNLYKNLYSKDLNIRTAGGGMLVKTPDNTKIYKISVDNAGALVTTVKSFF